MTVIAATVIALACAVFAETRSGVAYIELRPGESSFWHTATNATLSLPVDFPRLASSATLSVQGVRYSRTYAGITPQSLTGGVFLLSLPPANSSNAENVYDLTLSFDDGTQQTAKLGLLDGAFGAALGTTRCLFDKDSSEWQRTDGKAVLPIPSGVETVLVDGVQVDVGLGGHQGWYAMKMPSNGSSRTVAMSHDGEDIEATLFGIALGFIMWFK
jgi:hypothetical protein